MLLNEQTGKIDVQLELVCRKFEKVFYEHATDASLPMPFKPTPDSDSSKHELFSLKYAQITIIV
jgi:hypothetical protein